MQNAFKKNCLIQDKIYVEEVVRQGVYENGMGRFDIKLNFQLPSQIYNLNCCQLQMSSQIILDNIAVSNNPAPFLDSMHFDITFTALEAIPDVIEWKIIYVGSAKNQQCDQTLEEFEIGPILEPSSMKFSVQCPAPDYQKIPRDQLLCVTALILTVSYKNQQFIRVGYYVHNMLTIELSEQQKFNTSTLDLITHTKRTILTDKPRITKFRINWENQSTMKEETISISEKEYDSKNSLLANKVGLSDSKQTQQKFTCSKEEKQQNSLSLMKSETYEVEQVVQNEFRLLI